MKNLLALMAFIVYAINGISQTVNITLTFSAMDSVTGNQLALDSVQVTNLTENCDTTLQDSISVLSLNTSWPFGINESTPGEPSSLTLMQNIPNPFRGTTRVRIWLKNDCDLNLTLYNNEGKVLSEYHNRFEKGWRLFGISSGETGMLFLRSSDNSTTKTIRIVSAGGGDAANRITSQGALGQIPGNVKSALDTSSFIFYLGNQLQYTAYADGYHESILFDDPISSETYLFVMRPVFNPVIPSVSTAVVTNITQISAISGGNVTSDGGAPVTVRGVCWSISPTPSIVNNTTQDGSGTGTFVSYLTDLNPGTLYYVRAYSINSVGTAYGNELTFTTLPPAFTCGSSITINHMAGVVAPVTKTTTYSTVTNVPGETSKCWITSNLGSDHQATAKDDATEASAGWYWQFNLKQGYKHDGSTRTPNTTWITPISEDSDWTAANDPCTLELGAGWRIPTSVEWTNVDASGGWTNWNGPWNSGLKLHAAGYLGNYDGSLGYRGSNGSYWSSTQYNAAYGRYLIFISGNCLMNGNDKANGFPLRCIKE